MKRLAKFLTYFFILFLFVIAGCGVNEQAVPPPSTGGTGGGGGGTPSKITVSFTDIATSAPITSIASGGAAIVNALVQDALNNPVSGVTVIFSVKDPSAGWLGATSAVTDASGIATPSPQFNAYAVNKTVEISASVGAVQNSATLTIGTPPRVPTSIIMVSTPTSSLASSGTATITATLSDAQGPINGVDVTFSLNKATAGSFTSPTIVTTNTSGVASVGFTANNVNMFVDVTATVGSLNNSITLQIGTPPPPVAASMSMTVNPLTISIQSQAGVSVKLLDASGNAAFGNAVTLTITAGADLASFSPFDPANLVSSVTVTTDAAGTAPVIVYSGTSSGTVSIQATSGLITRNSSLSITSDPDHIYIDAVNPTPINGTTTNITADVRNILNNPVSNGTVVDFAITAGVTNAGSLSAAQSSTANGIAQVTFIADPAISGTLIVTASIAGTSPLVSASVAITVETAQTGSIEFVSADPSVINIVGAGLSSSFVKFRVLSSTGTPLPGINVDFTLYGPNGATLDATNSTISSGSTDAQGEVTTILKAGGVAGPVRIVADVTVPGPPPITLSTSSGNISIGGSVPSDRWFSVSVSRYNLPDGLGCDGVESTIYAMLADRFGNYNILKGTSVSFNTDSGAINTSSITDDTGATLSVWRSQDPRPTDVDPMPWEPFYVDATGRTRNPRDGWATVLVSTTGEEYFFDSNSNGVYDPGETFTDLPEPFIDSNDDRTYEPGELFFDWSVDVQSQAGNPVNPNGIYDGPNGIWDEKIPIFRNITLVITGPPNFGPYTSRIATTSSGTGNVSIPKDSSMDFNVYASDVNMNAPSGGTRVSLSSDKSEADVKFIIGSETILDALSYGPAVITYRVTNNNKSAVAVKPTLSATIDWTGKCAGPITYTMTYPGTITLEPGAAPAAPNITVAQGPGLGEFTITWPDVAGATSYNLYWGTAPNAVTNTISSVTSPHVETGLTSGTTYYYQLTAVNSVGESAKSSAQSDVAP